MERIMEKWKEGRKGRKEGGMGGAKEKIRYI